MPLNTICRLCGDKDETMNHIISECNKLAPKEYKTINDWIRNMINGVLYKKFKFDHTKNWYIHNPEPVQENETHKLLCDFEIQTDPLISARQSEQVIANKEKRKKKRTCRIADFAVPADHRVKLKESKERDNYVDRELRKQWNIKVTLISIVTGALGTITKRLVQGEEDLETRGRVEIIHNTVLLISARILRRVLEIRVDLLSVENHQQKLVWKTLKGFK